MFGGKIMDSFMDKIAGKLQSSEVIKANSEAEAKQLDAYKERVAELEKTVAEMRRLNLKCVEINEATTQLVQGAIEKIDAIKAEEGGVSKEDLDKLSEEIHKDGVRVYRNVQASLVEELKQQTEALAIQHAHIEKKLKGVKPVMIVMLVLSSISFAMFVAAAIYLFLPIF